jgi:hypothetical protein
MEKIRILHIEDNLVIAGLVQEMLASDKGVSFEVKHFTHLLPSLESLDHCRS